jgi:hypothetical protein
MSPRWMPILILGIGACDLVGPVGSQQGYRPEQPVAYSHALHAGLYEMDCQYCHSGAERSRHAGVPPVTVCMNCHTQVKTTAPEILKLASYAREERPVEWVKVHRLPDFVFFSHASHVGAGLRCQECHGPVEQMVRVEQQETMTMGFCLRCHRELHAAKRDAPAPLATLTMARLQHPETVPARKLAPPMDCSACHR